MNQKTKYKLLAIITLTACILIMCAAHLLMCHYSGKQMLWWYWFNSAWMGVMVFVVFGVLIGLIEVVD